MKRNREIKRGEENALSKLSKDEVLEIYNRYYSGTEKCSEISKDYNISKELVSHIINNNHWYTKDIEPRERSRDSKVKSHKNYILSNREGQEIYYLYKNNSIKIKEIASLYGVGIFTVSKIISGKHASTSHLESINNRTIKSNPPMNKKMANKLKTLYEKQGKSIKELVKLSNYGVSTVRKAVKGEHFTQK